MSSGRTDNFVFEEETVEEGITGGYEDATAIMKELITEDEVEEIEVKLRVNKKAILLMILQYACTQKLAQCAIVSLIRLINCILQFPILQDSVHFINKLFKAANYVTYHAICQKCQVYAGKCGMSSFSVTCPKCNENIVVNATTGNFFVTIDPTEEVRHLLEANDVYYNHIVNERNFNTPDDPTVLTDLYDGFKYRQILATLTEDVKRRILTFFLNTDGSPVFQSSNFSVWPIQLMPNEIPVNKRLKSTITCALWFCKKKPDMNIFFKPFIDEFNKLTTQGIPCVIQGTNKNIIPRIIGSVADSVARAPMQCLHQFNGSFGCSWCLHPADNQRYSAKKGLYQDRTHEEAVRNMTEAQELRRQERRKNQRKKIHVNGFTATSPFIHLPDFDVISGFIPDYMHSVLLGIGRQFAKLWFDPQPIERSRKKGKKKKYNKALISESTIQKIDDVMRMIKPHSSVDRLSRPIRERKFWKAKEWEIFILVYSVPVLSNFLDEKRFDHWLKLVEAIYILLQTKITVDDLNRANGLLHSFVYEVEDLYSVNAMTSNVHQLLHLCQSVYFWGPLWAHSGYPFEDGNGNILKKIHGATAVLQQICKSFCFHKKVDELKEELKGKLDVSVIEYMRSLSSRFTQKCFETEENKYFGKAIVLTPDITNRFGLSSDVKKYNRMLRDGRIFCSCLQKMIRTNNSFAVLKSGDYVRLVAFLYDSVTTKEFTFVNRIKVVAALTESFKQLKKIDSIDDEVISVPTEDIDKPCNVIKVEESEFILAMPNIYYSS